MKRFNGVALFSKHSVERWEQRFKSGLDEMASSFYGATRLGRNQTRKALGLMRARKGFDAYRNGRAVFLVNKGVIVTVLIARWEP